MATSKVIQNTVKPGPLLAESGYIRFVPTAVLFDAAGNVTVPRTGVEGALVAGAFSVTVYANNDPTTSPSGTAYKVYVNDTLIRTVIVPYDMASPIELSDLPPAVVDPGDEYADFATLAVLNAVKAAGTATVISPNVISQQTVPLYVFSAPAPLTITYAAMSLSSAVNASDVSYWSIALTRYRDGASAVIATKTTQVTGGEAIVAGTKWVFDAGGFDAGNKVLLAGDEIAFFCSRIGSAASMINPQYILHYTLT